MSKSRITFRTTAETLKRLKRAARLMGHTRKGRPNVSALLNAIVNRWLNDLEKKKGANNNGRSRRR